MSTLKNLLVLCLIGFFLSACGDDSTRPKKPEWANQAPQKLLDLN